MVGANIHEGMVQVEGSFDLLCLLMCVRGGQAKVAEEKQKSNRA